MPDLNKAEPVTWPLRSKPHQQRTTCAARVVISSETGAARLEGKILVRHFDGSERGVTGEVDSERFDIRCLPGFRSRKNVVVGRNILKLGISGVASKEDSLRAR